MTTDYSAAKAPSTTGQWARTKSAQRSLTEVNIIDSHLTQLEPALKIGRRGGI